MRRGWLLSLVFVVYCVEMGTFLILWPWSGSWDRLWLQVPWLELRQGFLHPLARSLVAAFGALHLVWGAHDLDLLLSRWRDRLVADDRS